MTRPTNNARKVAISSAVVKKLKLPNSLLNNQLFTNGVYGAYSSYRYSNYYYHRYINKKICKDAKPLNFKPYEFKESQFAGFDFAPTIGLSVIIPAYNVEKFIVPCLDSIMNALNGYDDFEIIVVDDCSTDNTREVLIEIQQNYKNLSLFINEKNLGQSASRNKAIKLSKGYFITFVDSDDFLSYNILNLAMTAVEAHQPDILEFKLLGFSKEQEINPYLNTNEKQENFEIKTVKLKDLYLVAKGYPVAKIYQRNLFELIRFPEGLSWEDMIIYHIILAICKKYIRVNNIGYLYRNNLNSTSYSGKTKNLGYDQLYVIKYCLEMAKKNHLKMDNDFYKRLFLEASVFLNNRTGYLSDSDLSYIFNELEPVFQHAEIESILTLREKRMYETMKERNIEAWCAIAY